MKIKDENDLETVLNKFKKLHEHYLKGEKSILDMIEDMCHLCIDMEKRIEKLEGKL